MIGEQGRNWLGPTKSRKEVNLYFGWMYYINGILASMWMAEAVWLQYKDAIYAPDCYTDGLTRQMAVNFCTGSWRIFVTAIYAWAPDEKPDRLEKPQFAFIKIAPPLTLLMAVISMVVTRYWLIAEEGRVSHYVTEYKDKILPTMEEETAEKKNIQNTREDRIAYVTRAILEFRGDGWYYRRYFLANLLTGIIIFSQLAFLHFALGNIF